MRKKSQAILPFFAVQLVSMMIFIIVLLDLLTMTKDVKFTINEFDARTAFLLSGRRLVSSADCFAYEDKGLLFDGGIIREGSRVFPNILDYYKLVDYENFNCLRKDFYDKKSDVTSGYWDAANASGMAFKYDIRIVDLKTGEEIYNSTTYGNPDNSSTSLIGRIDKIESTSWSLTSDDCTDRYGSVWTRITNCNFVATKTVVKKGHSHTTNQPVDFASCALGRCGKGSTASESDIKPYWDTSAGECDYSFMDTQVINFGSDRLHTTDWTPSDTTCASTNSSPLSMAMPTMIKVGDELHPAIMYIQSCLISGSKYAGTTLLEIEYKPPTGGKCG